MEEITIENGKAYQKNIILYIPKPEKAGPVTFRLGFKRMSENGDIADPLWSDPVTMNVTIPEGSVRFEKPKPSPATVEKPKEVIDANDKKDDKNSTVAKNGADEKELH
jgi:hypothetical protein